MSIITNCIVDRSANKMSACTFDVINADTDDISNFIMNADIKILCFDGVIFSGKITEVEKTQMNGYDSTTPFYNLDVTCGGDYSKLSDLIIEKSKSGDYIDETSGELVEIILPDEWEGEIETDGVTFPFTISEESCASNITDIIDQTQYDWRCRRDYIRGEINTVFTASGTSGCYYGIRYYDTQDRDTNSFIDKYIYFVSGDKKYIAYGKILGDFNYGASYERQLGVYFDDAFEFGDNDTGTTCTDCTVYLSAGDVFVIPLEPLFDYSDDLSGTDPVQSFLLNTDFFKSSESSSVLGDVTQLTVSGLDQFGIKRNSTLTASYTQDGYDWDHCTYTKYREDGILSDEFSITTTSATMSILGYDFNPTTGDTFVVKTETSDALYYYNYTYVSHSETTDSSGRDVTEVVVTPSASNDQNRSFIEGSYVLHKRVIVEDTSQFFTGDVIAIGNEGMTVTTKGTVTIDTVDYSYLACTRGGIVSIDDIEFEEGYSHFIGTLVRNCDTYNRLSPQSGSPQDTYGTISRSISASGNSYRGNLDKYATNYLTGRSKFKTQGTGRCILKDFWKSDEDHAIAGPVPITVGDLIRVYSNDSTYVDYQMLSYKANMSTRQVSMDLGAINKNWFDLIALNSKSISRSI